MRYLGSKRITKPLLLTALCLAVALYQTTLHQWVAVDDANLIAQRRDALLSDTGRRQNPNFPHAVSAPTRIDTAQLAERIWTQYSLRVLAQQSLNATRHPKVIMYVCYTGMFCCGYGDRLRGMVFSFIAAVLTDSTFMVDHRAPIDMRDVFGAIPIRHRALFADPDQMDTLGDALQYDRLSKFSSNFTRSWDIQALLRQHDTIKIMTNELTWRDLTENPQLADRAQEYGMDRMSTLDLFRLFAHLYLQQPAPAIASAVSEQLKNMSRSDVVVTKIGVQIRTGGDDWPDDRRLPKNASLVFANEVSQYCRDRNCAVFLTSDSEIASGLFVAELNRVAHGIGVAKSDGRPVHLHAHGKASAEEHFKTFSDWIVLCHMDYLVISPSGFGETAAWVSEAPTRQVIAVDNVIDYDNIYGRNQIDK